MRIVRLTACVTTLGTALAVIASMVPGSAAYQRSNGLIAYTIGGGEEDNVTRTVRPDGTQDRRLVGPRTERWPLPFSRGVSGPRWSRDGKLVLFGGHHHYDRRAQSLWYSKASGKGLTRIPLRLGGVGKGPRAIYLFGWSWAPDGRHVVFAAGREIDRSTVYTIAMDGKRRKALRRGWWPEWSADGQHIVFTSRMDFGAFPDYEARTEIAVMRRDGSAFRRLTESSNDSDPSISPDGRTVLFVRRFGTVPFIEHPETWRDEWRTVDISGRREALVVTHYAWSQNAQAPSPFRYCAPQWSPDGTRLATVRSGPGTQQDIPSSTFVTFDLTGKDERVEFDFPFPYLGEHGCDFSWQPR